MAGVHRVAGILGGLSLLGLALAGFGLYAVVAFGTTQRAFEVGVRMALGATGLAVIRTVTRDVVVLVGLGIGAGGLLAAAAAALISSSGLLATANLRFSGPVADLATIATIALLMVAVACAAAFFPVRHATRVDPLVALRRL